MQARQVPTIPPPEKRIRLLIDTDAATEVDDQYALALALCTPERFDLRGIVAAHFGDDGGPTGITQSAEEIARVLAAAGLTGRFPVLHGSHPLRYSCESSPSEGVDFICSEAHLAIPEDPLWIVALGPATNIVSAYLHDPSIVERVVVLYHGRTHWPEKCWNYNVYNDARGTRAVSLHVAARAFRYRYVLAAAYGGRRTAVGASWGVRPLSGRYSSAARLHDARG